MESIGYIFLLMCFGVVMVASHSLFGRHAEIVNEPRYMGDGVVFFNGEIYDHKADSDEMIRKFRNESHNMEVDLEKKMDELRYRHECTDAIFQAQSDMWKEMGDEVKQMSAEEKLEWIPKWIEYLSELKADTKYTDEDKSWITMGLDFYIACYLDENWYRIKTDMNIPIRLRKGYIYYE